MAGFREDVAARARERGPPVTVTVELLLNGARVPVVLDEAAVAAIAAAQAGTPAEPWPEWMNVETAARYLDVTVERLRKLQARGVLPHYQEGPGCRVFLRRAELDEWMQGFRVERDGPT